MNPDFIELLREFNAAGVEFLVVGAHALAAHGHVRATRDLDIWVRPDPANAGRTYEALARFGAPLDDLRVDDLAREGLIFQIGVPPVRIDIITRVDAVTFEEAWRDRLVSRLGGETVGVLSKEHLIRNKRATGRIQDLADIERLEG